MWTHNYSYHTRNAETANIYLLIHPAKANYWYWSPLLSHCLHRFHVRKKGREKEETRPICIFSEKPPPSCLPACLNTAKKQLRFLSRICKKTERRMRGRITHFCIRKPRPTHQLCQTMCGKVSDLCPMCCKIVEITWHTFSHVGFMLQQYSVTHQVGPNFRLTSKQMLRFSMWILY